jgi:hypothetical protein
MSFKDRLERLHDSRRRQKERAETGGADGADNDQADKSVYYADDIDEAQESPDEPPDQSAPVRGNDDEFPASSPTPADVSRETSPDRPSDNDSPSTSADPTSGATTSDTAPGGEVYQKLERSHTMKKKSRSSTDSTSQTGAPEPDGQEAPADHTDTGADDPPSTLTIHRESDAGEGASGPDRDATTPASSPTTSTDRSHSDSPSTDVTSQRGGDLGHWVANLRREADEAINRGDWEQAAPKLFEIVALVPNHPFALDHLAEYHERRDEQAAAERYRERLRRQSPFGN